MSIGLDVEQGVMWCPVIGHAAAPEIYYPSGELTSTTTQSASLFPLLSVPRAIVLVSLSYVVVPAAPAAANQQFVIYNAITGAEWTRLFVAGSYNGNRLGILIPGGQGFGVKFGSTDAAPPQVQIMWRYAAQ